MNHSLDNTFYYNSSWTNETFFIEEYNNITTNETFSETKSTALRLYDILIPSIGLFSIIMNFAVVISSGLILKKGQQPRTTYLFLGNVAMTDLITSLSVVFGQMYPNKYREHYVCSIQLGMIVSSTLASVLSVGLIAVDRYLYILHGFKYQKWMYPNRARLCIVLTWVIGCIIGYLPLMGWAGDTLNGKKCWFILLAPKNLILLTVAIGSIPLITVAILYSVILFHAIKNIIRLQTSQKAQDERAPENPENGIRSFRGNSVDTSASAEPEVETAEKPSFFRRFFMKNPSNKVKAPNKWKAIKVVMFTSGSFVFTWGPYFVAAIIYSYAKDEELLKKLSILIASPLAILGFFNTLVNPIIYAWWHKGFRSFIHKRVDSIKKKRKESKSASSKNTSSSNVRRKSSSSSATGEAAGAADPPVKIKTISEAVNTVPDV